MNDSIHTLTDTLQIETFAEPLPTEMPTNNVELLWLQRPIYFDSIPYVGIVLLVMIGISLFLLARYRKAHLYNLRNFFTIHDRSMGYEPETTEWWGKLLKWLVVFCSYAIYIMLLISIYSSSLLIKQGYLTLICFAAIGLYFLLHLLIFRFLNYVFNGYANGLAYIEAYYTVISSLAFALIPCSIGIVYLQLNSFDILLIISYILIGIAFLLLIFKSIQLFYRKIASLFYIILYFCTLEIIPILLLWKIVSFWVS